MRAELEDGDVERIAQRVVELLREQRFGLETERRWLTTAEAAEHLRMSVDALHRLTAGRQVPHVRQGGRLIFDVHELDKWLQEHAVADRSASNLFPDARNAA